MRRVDIGQRIDLGRLKGIDRDLANELGSLRFFSEVLDRSADRCMARDAMFATRAVTEHLPAARKALAHAKNLSTSSGMMLGEDLYLDISRELRGYEKNLDASDRKFDEKCSCSRKNKRFKE